jgi:uncharacterized repeat protein (TIGR03899 family)
MKIDNQNTPTPVPVEKVKNKPSTEVSSSAESPVKGPQDVKGTAARMTQWFAQIGVSLPYQGMRANSIESRVQRRQKIAAQRKLSNIESVFEKALKYCIDEGENERLDPDWFYNFANMAEEIHSPAMQELWGKIFAVETNRPGSFSLRTLLILKQLTQKDAQTFRRAVALSSRRKGDSTPKLLTGFYQQPSILAMFRLRREQQLNLATYGLSYPDLLSLMDLGLIHQTEIESGEWPVNSVVEWRSNGQVFQLSARKPGTTLKYYKFTTSGAELFTLVGVNKQAKYIEALKHILLNAFVVD